MELAACEEVIPALVEAQHRRLDPAVADLLRGAIERARPDLIEEAPACEGLARLALLRGEPEAAHHWARRALLLQPLSATARHLLAECERSLIPPDGAPDVIATIGERARGRAA